MRKPYTEDERQFFIKNAHSMTITELSNKTGRSKGSLREYLTRHSIPYKKRGEDLSEREREVLCLLSKGMSDSEIAERLFISIHTLKTHINNIMIKLNLISNPSHTMRVRAVLWYLRTVEDIQV